MIAEPGMRNFLALDHTGQVDAMKKLAAAGMGEYAIGAATQLSVEEVRRILRETSESLA